MNEVEYDTLPEMNAFLAGLNYVGDIDVSASEIMERNGKYVVKVMIGDLDEEED